MLRLIAVALSLAATSASAMVGNAPPAGDFARAAVMISGSRGNFCTGILLARDLVLTAAHCVPTGFEYKLIQFDAQKQPSLRDIARIERHPNFSQKTFDNHVATADVALIKLAAPAQNNAQGILFSGPFAVAAGDRFSVAGYGLTERGNGRTGGTLRAANLVATGKPGSLQIRLVDPAAKGERAGLGACTGDSGAPVFREDNGRALVIGVVSWSTGPNNSEGCGGLTGVTPLSLYRGWIVDTAKKIGSPLAP